MSLNFDASEDFHKSITDIDTLLQFAIEQRDKGEDNNRNLFLKLAVVSVVTKFQVFIEKILEEYKEKLKKSNKKYSQMSTHFRLNSIRLFFSSKTYKKTLKKIEGKNEYTDDKLKETKNMIEKLLNFCTDNKSIDEDIQFDTNFPLGKTGPNELIKLFEQINGEDIFDNSKPDMKKPDKDKLNEILNRRNNIVHQDKNQQITENTLQEYKDYLLDMVEYLDNYLQTYL